MTSLDFAASLSYAAVADRRGGDPRPRARELFRENRVLAALRDADAAWSDADEESVVQVAVSEDGFVLTLDERDAIVRTLRVPELRARFADAGLVLWLDDPASDDEVIDDYDFDDDDDPDEGFEEDEVDADALDADALAELFAERPVRVRELSHFGPMAARVRATQEQVGVVYAEVRDWSITGYETTGASSLWAPSKAEAPRLSVNLPGDIDHAWVEVTTQGLAALPVPFWPNAERGTRPALDIDRIRIPEVAATYRMILAEGDGMRDELDEIARRCELDVDLAHSALVAEALGGVVGAEERIRVFLRAFDVPEELIDAAMSDAGAASLPGARRFAPQGWPRTIRDILLGGAWEAAALTRRTRPVARLSHLLQRRPALGMAWSALEALGGVVVAAKAPGRWKALGWMMIVDAAVDAVLHVARRRRPE